MLLRYHLYQQPDKLKVAAKGISVGKKQNILLIVADQWRGDYLPADWGGDMDLPNLSRLARDGALFKRHYCNASPCGPARACLLTGQYMMNHRVVQNGVPLRDGKTNLALELQKFGMLSGLVGYTSWIPDPHSTAPSDPRFSMYGANMPGFTPVQSFEEPEFEAYFSFLRSKGYVLPENPFEIWNDTVTEIGIKPSPIAAEHSDTRWMTDAALDFITGRGTEPWCLFLGYWRPHPPISVSAPFHEFTDPKDLSKPNRLSTKAAEADRHPVLSHLIENVQAGDYLQGVDGPAADLSDDAIQNARAVYRGMMKEIDDNVGRLLDRLEREGVLDDTLIVFTSDHGEMLGDHYLFGKESYFEPTFHVPLIIRDPRKKADKTRGQLCDLFTEHVDIMPTVLDFLGAGIPRQCDGHSLLPLLEGELPAWRDNAFMEVDFRDLRHSRDRALGTSADECGAAIIRGERYKYVHFPAFDPILFDLVQDPDEFNNIAREPAAREDMICCMSSMLDWRISQADRTLTAVSSSTHGLLGWPNIQKPERAQNNDRAYRDVWHTPFEISKHKGNSK
ncbi:sulfatase-like hydrolase/transferase [Roseibium marinum]|uniref:Arylsulfatase A-like enzyme n=1 Tax=Roseibium marinum TaxID=281252 RepID=A0A2S3UKS7_9HYPH|nr:sulfatase-like hydrolase/transferase [Roseibium marinum]POF28314.1 arylsulfatase A-like enzyme [Roseibium marinum]